MICFFSLKRVNLQSSKIPVLAFKFPFLLRNPLGAQNSRFGFDDMLLVFYPLPQAFNTSAS